jgi:hypothetical protein
MSIGPLTICLYLQDGTPSSTLHPLATETRKEVVQLAIWLAHAIMGTAVVEASGDGIRPIHVVAHPNATRPPEGQGQGRRSGPTARGRQKDQGPDARAMGRTT